MSCAPHRSRPGSRAAARPRLSRRRWLRTVLCLFALPAVNACAPAPAPLRIAANLWPGYAFLFVARDLGELEAAAVELIELSSASETLHALAYGFLDGAALTLDEVLRARAAGIDLVVIAVLDVSLGADALLTRPAIQSLTELAGKRVGVEPSGTGAILLAKALEHAGIPRKAIEAVTIEPHQLLRAWQAQTLDAVVCYEPYVSRLRALGARRLFDSRAIAGLIVDVLAVRRATLERNPHALRRLLQAHFEMLERWRRQPARIEPVLAARFGVPPLAVAYLFSEIELLGIAENRQLLMGHAPLLAERAVEIQRIVFDAALPQPLLDPHDWLRGDFLPS